MIEAIDEHAVIGTAYSSLGLERGDEGILSACYLSAAVRRLAGFLCPCSPRTLVRRMVDSHHGLVDDVATFIDLVEASIESLVAIGDLLELGDVALEGEQVRGTWLVAAPPGYVVRPGGTAFVLGLSADEQTPLPTEMRSRVEIRRGIRSITPLPTEDLATVLHDLGLRHLSESAWLKHPKPVSAKDLITLHDTKLSGLQASGEIPDMIVLDGSRRARSYKGRWTSPGTLTGNFVVRRPQTFGSDLWGYAQLVDGQPRKLMDLPLHGDRWRGCDAAWRIQMAIDTVAGRPQEYRLREAGGDAILDFFFPIPMWARKRLAVIGSEIDPAGCLLSFLVPQTELATEEKFLSEMLFLAGTAE
ncbi:hypothetical protein V6U71_13660 [Sphingopyxis sp. J-6]|uniref:hypothetical protein n=1 Tax=Sphingopyxis sp. J-6 TaxID=3122054 RepID=UPI00398442D8